MSKVVMATGIEATEGLNNVEMATPKVDMATATAEILTCQQWRPMQSSWEDPLATS